MIARSFRAYVYVAVGLMVMAVSASAGAYERQHHVGLGAGISPLAVSNDATSLGLSGSLGYRYGLNDEFDFMAEGSFSLRFSPAVPEDGTAPPVRPTAIGSAGLGAIYIFDILRWVPYAGVLLGASYLNGGGMLGPLIAPDAQIAAGMNYQVTRNWAVGVGVRQHFLLLNLGDYPSYTTVNAVGEYTWGW